MTATIRFARREDVPAIAALMRALAEFEKLPGPTDEAIARLAEHGFGERRYFEALVAERQGDVVAYAIFFTNYSTFRAQPGLYLEDLFVHPDARRGGIAKGLLERLQSLAAERGCGRFEWSVLDWNVDAQKLYDGLGARRMPQWLMYRMDLD